MTSPEAVEFNPSWLDREAIEMYRSEISSLRAQWEAIPGKRGPRWYAVTMCDECKAIGMTSSRQPQRRRFRCWTCGGCKLPVWADGKTPDEDDIWETWAKTAPKEKR